MKKGFFRMEVKLVGRTALRGNGSMGRNSAVKAAAYIDGQKYKERAITAVEAGAYISGGKLYVHESDEVVDYRKKSGVVESWVMLHPNAPKRLQEPEALWNEVEQVERACDATLFREFIICFDKHTTSEQRKQIAEKFGQTLLDEGMAAVHIALHDEKDGNGNFHCHILSPHRSIDENGEWEERIAYPRGYMLDEKGERIPVIDKQTGEQKRDASGQLRWVREPIRYLHDFNDNRLDNVTRWREVFCRIENQYLPEEYQVSPLSYAAQGIDKVPGEHLGKAGTNVHRKLAEQVQGLLPETRQQYLQRILKEVQSEYRRAYYEHSRELSAQRKQGGFVESTECSALRQNLQLDMQAVKQYLPQKDYITRFAKSIGSRMHLEKAFAELLLFYQSQYYSQEATQEQTAEMMLKTLDRVTQAEEDLLIMFSTGLTASMNNGLVQGVYDMKKELLKQLGAEIRQTEKAIAELTEQMKEGEEDAIREKLDEYRTRIQSIRARRADEASDGTGCIDSGAGAGNSESETRAVEYARTVSELASELRESNQRLGRASHFAAESAECISELESWGASERKSKARKKVQ